MENKKRRTMALLADNMPMDVFNILDAERNKRNLTQFIVNLVRESQKNKVLMENLERIEKKIDNLNPASVTIKEYSMEENFDDSLEEGQIITTNKFTGGMDEEDAIDVDF